MTNEQLVSRIVNDIRALNKDEHISRRYILQIAKDKAKFLLAQKLRDRSLFREEDLYTHIDCFALESDDIVKCDIVEFKRCKSLMKSKKKLPDLLFSRFGDSIANVTTVDGMIEFLPTTPTQYRLNLQRKFAKYVTKNYYFVKDGYLYLPDSEVEGVNVVLLTVDNDEADSLSDCKECDSCKSIWEYDFVCSDKLTEAVIADTIQEVLSTYKQIVPDENPNMDETQRGKTTI